MSEGVVAVEQRETFVTYLPIDSKDAWFQFRVFIRRNNKRMDHVPDFAREIHESELVETGHRKRFWWNDLAAVYG